MLTGLRRIIGIGLTAAVVAVSQFGCPALSEDSLTTWLHRPESVPLVVGEESDESELIESSDVGIIRFPARTVELGLSKANGDSCSDVDNISPELELTQTRRDGLDCESLYGISFSAEGEKAAFPLRDSDTLRPDGIMVAENGSNQTLAFLHPNIVVEGTRISPDGNYVGVGYMEEDDLLTRLAGVLEVKTGRLTQIGIPYFLKPAGTPPLCNGGKRAVFTQNDKVPTNDDRIGTTALYIYEAETREVLRLATDFRVIRNTAISPDCNKVAFVYDLWEADDIWGDGERYRLGVIDLTNPREPTAKSILVPGNFYLDGVVNMVFSEDGSKVAFRNHPDYTTALDYFVDLETGKVLVVEGKRNRDELLAKTSVAVKDASFRARNIDVSHQSVENFDSSCSSE